MPAFEVSFAGKSFTLPDPDGELLAWIDRHVPLDAWSETSKPPHWPGKNLAGIAWPQWWPDKPCLKIGDFYYPTHASRWAEFRGLATAAQIQAMKAVTVAGTYGVPTGNFKVSIATTQGAIGVEAITETEMLMLPPRPLAQFSAGGYEDLYLVTLVDERYFWQWKPSGKWQSDDFWTWNAAFNAIEANLGISIDTGIISSVYGDLNADSPFYNHYENAAWLLDALAWNIGRVFVRDLEQNYWLNDITDDNDTIAAAYVIGTSLRAGGGNISALDNLAQKITALPTMVPSSVIVTFPKYALHEGCGWMGDQRPDSFWVKQSYGDVWPITVNLSSLALAVTSGFSGTKVFHDTARAYFIDSTDATPDNEADLTALATQIATDYYNRQLTVYDETRDGIWVWEPEGNYDVVWSFCNARTRIMRKPYDFGALELQHYLSPSTDDYSVETQAAFLAQITGRTSGYLYTFAGLRFDKDGNLEASGINGEAYEITGRDGTTFFNPIVATENPIVPTGTRVVIITDHCGSYAFERSAANYNREGIVSINNQTFSGIKTFQGVAFGTTGTDADTYIRSAGVGSLLLSGRLGGTNLLTINGGIVVTQNALIGSLFGGYNIISTTAGVVHNRNAIGSTIEEVLITATSITRSASNGGLNIGYTVDGGGARMFVNSTDGATENVTIDGTTLMFKGGIYTGHTP